MNIQIVSADHHECGSYLQASCGKTSAMVFVHSYGLQVICQNAAHKVWRGTGRFFNTPAEALNGYRSAEMRAIIDAAVNFYHAREAA